MKVWEKIYIGTLCLFLVILNLSICTAFSLSYTNSLKTEKDTAYIQWKTISEAFQTEILTAEEGNSLREESITNLFQQYGGKYSKSGLTLDFWTKETLHTEIDLEQLPNNDYSLNQEIIEYCNENKKYVEMVQRVGKTSRVLVLDYNEEKLIAVAGTIEGADEYYTFTLVKELTGFKSMWFRMIGTFALIELIASILLAILLYYFIHRILNPLEKLSKAADAMATGELGQMVLVEGKDEISFLAKRFNHMATEVSRSMMELEEESKKTQQFIDDLAHEIRTPLTTIQGYSQLLQNVVISEEKRIQYLTYIMNEAKRIHRMSDELLKLSLLKREEIVFSWFDNESMLIQGVEPFIEMAKKQGIMIRTETDGKKTYGNQILLQSVIVNLIKNAMNACLEGGEIIVGIYENRIYVSDTGIGMSEECKRNIFEPYYREDKARSRGSFGVGLGMTICKQIIDLHHGDIHITSEINQGTVIEIILSLKA